MNCPFCSHFESKVVDSRPTDEGQAIRRRRECVSCHKRFTTYEKIEEIPLIVVKKSGNRESFNRNKVLNGMIRACEKRPVPLNKIEAIVDHIEKQLYNSMEKEITTEFIGTLVIDQIKQLDEVAYVRFASVYREFKDINTFMDELKKLLKEKPEEA
ncbi:ATP-cone domain protein [Alkaliphilus metalliredigens QYMF]|uniref:Transcriptional repressor NrdR n=1 Tax=Alkaliphilus metalliredigens (strain QYMF) TaxID=293826 RepID=NRDR_ALKMQ|nr:transcriptional regulator NrdR [Alkaliphilus metalliredigens]A6TS50.1 RecName: Full=Transcriptional repressor NrdR [Alkaliphilus metalliredigens QYMF]ABR49018.1 ATP-cone domain protein [Alkaliphilus metalliredigens QYMF]